MDLQTLQNLIRSDPSGLTGGAQGDNAFYRVNGGDMGYGLTYSPEWMNAVNDTTPYQQGDNGWFWSDGNQTYTPSALKSAQLAGTANPADYVTGFNEIPSYSNDAYAGNSKWQPGSMLGAALTIGGLAAGLGAWGNGLFGIGEGLGGISASDAAAAMGSGVDAAGWGSGALDALGGASAASGGAYPWLDAAGNLDVDKFLTMTGPGGEYASAIPGGAEGIAGIDTAASTPWWQNALNKVSGSKDAVSALGKALSSFGTTPTIDTGMQMPSYGQSNAVSSTQSTPNTLENPSLTQSQLTPSPQNQANYGFTDLTPANDNFLRSNSTWNTHMANALRSR